MILPSPKDNNLFDSPITGGPAGPSSAYAGGGTVTMASPFAVGGGLSWHGVALVAIAGGLAWAVSR